MRTGRVQRIGRKHGFAAAAVVRKAGRGTPMRVSQAYLSRPLMAVAYVVIPVVLTIAAPAASVVFVGIGVMTLMLCLFMVTARANNRRFQATRTDLTPWEEARFSWKAGFPSMGARWVIFHGAAVDPQTGAGRSAHPPGPLLRDLSGRHVRAGLRCRRLRRRTAGRDHALQPLPWN